MGKQTKGVKVQRPGAKAGEPCEGPGCEVTECSRWLAAGRCCTKLKCQEYFDVGKGKAVAMEKAAEELSLKRKREAAAQPGPLKVGEALFELPPWVDSYFDEHQHYSLRSHLVTSLPFTVSNVRRDEYGGEVDYSFLVFGTFEGVDHKKAAGDMKVDTRWVTFGMTLLDNGGTGVEAAPAALDFMELSGAHEQDVATVRSAYVKCVDEQWEKRRSQEGSVWYHNALLKVTTWEEPGRQY